MFDLGVSRTSTKDAVLKLLLKANPTWTNEEKEQMEARAVNEINSLVARIGSWGQYMRLCQRGKELTEEESLKAKTNVNKVIMKQHKTILDGAMETAWEVHKNSFPTLYDLGQRILALSIESADVERVCKANGLIHSKSRNRLRHSNVQKLLFCYVNLRLIKSQYGKDEDFLDQSSLDVPDD